MLMIEPRGIGRRGWVLGIDGLVEGAGGVVLVAAAVLPGAGVLICAKTARAAARAASVCWGRGARAAGEAELAELESAWRTELLGLICMIDKTLT